MLLPWLHDDEMMMQRRQEQEQSGHTLAAGGSGCSGPAVTHMQKACALAVGHERGRFPLWRLLQLQQQWRRGASCARASAGATRLCRWQLL